MGAIYETRLEQLHSRILRLFTGHAPHDEYMSSSKPAKEVCGECGHSKDVWPEGICPLNTRCEAMDVAVDKLLDEAFPDDDVEVFITDLGSELLEWGDEQAFVSETPRKLIQSCLVYDARERLFPNPNQDSPQMGPTLVDPSETRPAHTMRVTWSPAVLEAALHKLLDLREAGLQIGPVVLSDMELGATIDALRHITGRHDAEGA